MDAADAAGSLAAQELDSACVTNVARFIDDGATFAAFLRVCRLWRACALDPSLPFWRVLNAERFRALGGDAPGAPPFCACAATLAVRRLRGVLRHVDLRGAVACPACAIGGDEARCERRRTLFLQRGSYACCFARSRAAAVRCRRRARRPP
jgi:hypothetical protein